MDVQLRKQLELQIDMIRRDCPAPRVAPSPVIETIPGDDEPALALREPFARWLLAQEGRGDWIDDLARSVRADPRFPYRADPDEVRRHLLAVGVSDADVYEQVDDAERVWLSL